MDKLQGKLFGVGFQTVEKLEVTWLASIFDLVGSKTEAESMEASKTKVKINGGRQTSVPLGKLTQSDLRLQALKPQN